MSWSTFRPEGTLHQLVTGQEHHIGSNIDSIPYLQTASRTAFYLDRVKRIWYLSPMRAAKVQASLRIRAVSPEPPLLAHTSSKSRGTFRQKARSLAPLNGWACAVKICHNGMLEDTNSLDVPQISSCSTHSRGLRVMDCVLLSISAVNARSGKENGKRE